MAGEERDRFEIPKDMRSMAEASFDQARKGFEKFIAGAQAAADSLSARTATVGAGAKDARRPIASGKPGPFAALPRRRRPPQETIPLQLPHRAESRPSRPSAPQSARPPCRS